MKTDSELKSRRKQMINFHVDMDTTPVVAAHDKRQKDRTCRSESTTRGSINKSTNRLGGEASLLTFLLGDRISTKYVLSAVVHPKQTAPSWRQVWVPNREAFVQTSKHPMSTAL